MFAARSTVWRCVQISSACSSNDSGIVAPSARKPLNPLITSSRASPRISVAWLKQRYGGNTPSGLCEMTGIRRACRGRRAPTTPPAAENETSRPTADGPSSLGERRRRLLLLARLELVELAAELVAQRRA